jgi:hypothetical protein
VASPVEIVPSDRLIFMIGQPIIRLFASGGPGGDLGDLSREKARNGMGSFDALGCCGNEFSLADLACCGADEFGGMGQTTVPAPSASGPATPSVVANAAKNAADQCKGIDDRIAKFLDAVSTADAKDPAQAKALRAKVKVLRKTFRACLRRLNAIVGPHKEKLKKSGMGQVVAYATKKSELEACRDKVAALRARWNSHMTKFHG